MDTLCEILSVIGALFIAVSIPYGLYTAGIEEGKKDLVQELCEKKQYDFCEVIEQKPEYKLKELKQDD